MSASIPKVVVFANELNQCNEQQGQKDGQPRGITCVNYGMQFDAHTGTRKHRHTQAKHSTAKGKAEGEVQVCESAVKNEKQKQNQARQRQQQPNAKQSKQSRIRVCEVALDPTRRWVAPAPVKWTVGAVRCRVRCSSLCGARHHGPHFFGALHTLLL